MAVSSYSKLNTFKFNNIN